MLPQRQHHLIDDVSVRGVEDDLALVLSHKGFALLGGLLHAFRHAHCDVSLHFHPAMQMHEPPCPCQRQKSTRVAARTTCPADAGRFCGQHRACFGDGLVRVILRVGHLFTKAHKACCCVLAHAIACLNVVQTLDGSYVLISYKPSPAFAWPSDAGHHAALLVMPTGSGKTVVFTEICRSCDKGKKVLILVHRRELVTQASDKLTKAGVKHGIIAAGFDPSKPQSSGRLGADTNKRLTQAHSRQT